MGRRRKNDVLPGQLSFFDMDLNSKEVRIALHGETASSSEKMIFPSEATTKEEPSEAAAKNPNTETETKVETKKPNHRGRGRTPAERKEAYAKYNALKRAVIEMEKRNTQYLILFPASDADINEKHKFYNMGGNSAIIYCHEIGPRIKRKPTLRRDMDNGKEREKFHSGICSIADVEKLTELLRTIGVDRVQSEHPFLVSHPELILFKLNREYTQAEIKEMLKLEQKRLDSLNKLLYSKVLHPDIHRQIIELKKIIPAKVKNMEKTYREVIGMEMIKTLMVLVRTYSQMAHGSKDELEAGKIMMGELDALLGEISIMNELRIWDVSTCTRVGDVVIGAKKIIRGKIINKYEAAE